MSAYNAITPTSLKRSYGPNDIVDFNIVMKPGRSMVPGSLRLSGMINVKTISAAGVPTKLRFDDHVHLDMYAGVHSVIRSVNTSVNSATIENVNLYNRMVSMSRQANYDLATLNSSSLVIPELCGTGNNIMLIGNDKIEGNQVVSFSALLMNCLNQASGPMAQNKFQNIQVSITLADAIEALYSDLTENSKRFDDAGAFSGFQYSLYDLQLNWVELIGQSGSTQEVIMPVKNVYQQSIQHETSFLNITAPAMYNSLSMSFIEQSKVNKVFHNNLLCEKIKGIDLNGGGVEILINGSETPIPFELKTYQELAYNYLLSLNGNPSKNSITNKLLNDNSTFGIGFALLTSSYDRLAVQLKINSEAYGSVIPPYDCFIYTNSFISL